MRKIIQILVLTSLLVSSLSAQIGNEWINYDAEYVKVSVSENGFYRVSGSELEDLNINTSNIDPQTLRLIRRGRPVSITVSGTIDDTFSGDDYIEFFGYANDGFDEDSLYFQGRHNLRDYSNYTDTAGYFLTWNNGTSSFIDSALVQEASLAQGQILKNSYQRNFNAVNNGPEYSSYIFYTEGDWGEGFVGSWIRDGVTSEYEIGIDEFDVLNGTGVLNLQFVGGRNGTKYVDLNLKNETDSLSFTSESFTDYNTIDVALDLPVGFVTSNLTLSITLNTSSQGADFASLVKHSLDYKSINTFSASNIETFNFFNLTPNTSETLILQDGSYELYKVIDSTTTVFLGEISSSFELTNSSNFNQKYLIRKTDITNVKSNIEIVEFQTIDVNSDYIIVTNKSLIEGAEEIKLFKETELGGGRNVDVLDIDKLYDTYTYGDKNPISIRRVVKDYIKTGQPKFLFIIGRGYSPTYATGGVYNRHNPLAVEFVPTFGNPGSDLLFTKGLGASVYEPFLATGRLSVESNEEVIDYLNKLKEHSLLTSEDYWTKNMLHLSGGSDQAEANYFYELINIYKSIAKDELMGANVDLLAKKTNSAVELYNISEQLNEGLSMITYLGHSSPYTIEMDLGSPTASTSDYDNQGKYPVMFINGCRTANVFTFGHSPLLNTWVNAKERGGILGIGHTGYAYASTLHLYTSYFYEVAFTDSSFYGKSIGEIQQETIRKFSETNADNSRNYTQMTQQIILGDPDLKMIAPQQADFSIKEDYADISAYREGDYISTSVDSINLNFTIQNFGLVNTDSIEVCITRNYNDTSYVYSPFVIATPAFEESYSFTLFNNIEGSNGINIFDIYIDCNDAYDEFNEDNNQLSFEYFMPSNGVNLLYPYPYAIVEDRIIDFVVESQDQSIDSSFYVFEISKKSDFEQIISSRIIKGSNVATFQNVNTNVTKDTTTYYWRSRLQNIEIGEDTVWQTSSFTYISNKTGWGQFEYDQFKEDDLDNLKDYQSIKKIDFDTLSLNLEFKTIGGNFDGSQKGSTELIVNNRSLIQYLNDNCWLDGYLVLPFDGETFESYEIELDQSYSTCGIIPRAIAHFRSDVATQLTRMQSYIDSIPVGDYVVIISVRGTDYNKLTDPLIESLAEFGCEGIDTIATGLPYVFVGRKGNDEPLYQQILLNDTVQLLGDYQINESTNKGEISNLEIGPSYNWDSWGWSFSQDSLEILNTNLYQGEKGIGQSDSFKNELSLNVQGLDSFEPLELSAEFTDPLNQSLSDLNYWSISYDIAPEGVVVPSLTGEEPFVSQDYFQGDTLDFDVSFMNISPVDFDSVMVTWSLTNLISQDIYTQTEFLAPLVANDTIIYSINSLVPFQFGLNEFKIIFNPKEQIEQFYQNNSFIKYINIIADKAAPVTEVYLDKDIPQGIETVSSNPVIDYYIRDNNSSSSKKDTFDIEMYLSGPCEDFLECAETRVYFSDTIVTYSWTSDLFHGSLNYNSLSPGLYEFKVYGADAFGNKSIEPSVVRFEVVLGSAISSFLPYPSPFSSEMRFAYTKLGDKQPEFIKIQIISSTGSLVKEITKEELGVLKAGDNLTDWFWDGTDSRGALLANGIYLYKVILEDNEIDHIPTSADNAFNKDWGTIMIVR